jgi:hypothetical protein
MTTDPDIRRASLDDIAGILDLQRENLPERGGALSAEFTHEGVAHVVLAYIG